MKIAIFGTRGIPNAYGGFEQFAQYLSVGLVEKGHEVIVYNSHNHPYQKKEYQGVQIIHAKDPEKKIGTAGQFIYDLNCIRDIRKRNFDIILQLGYTSSSVWSRLLKRSKGKVVTNMDGLEWKRSKYSKSVQRFLRYAEKLAVRHSDHLVSDSLGIREYLNEKYGVDSTYIPYGADPVPSQTSETLKEYGLEGGSYNILIARMEPENNIEMILDAVSVCGNSDPFIVIGKYHNKFGSYLREKFKTQTQIRFLGGIYDMQKLNELRYHSKMYFHGHSVGGTNPSLLEAMASSALICAHDNRFNKAILGADAFYFSDVAEVSELLKKVDKNSSKDKIAHNLEKINSTYSWSRIIDAYNDLFIRIKG